MESIFIFIFIYVFCRLFFFFCPFHPFNLKFNFLQCFLIVYVAIICTAFPIYFGSRWLGVYVVYVLLCRVIGGIQYYFLFSFQSKVRSINNFNIYLNYIIWALALKLQSPSVWVCVFQMCDVLFLCFRQIYFSDKKVIYYN